MKNMLPVEENLINYYENIANSCRGQKKMYLLNEMENINDRYKLYLENRKTLSKIEKLDYSQKNSVKDILISCYTSNTIALSQLKVEIINKQELFLKAKCPYCGINSHGSFDHYLPKESYPEYAVLANNLVPSCEKCNSLKGEKWLDQNEKRLFINYYYDPIPKEKYLFAYLSFDISSSTPTVTYKVENRESINSDIYNIIENQYGKLHLCERFEFIANEEISTLYNGMQRNKNLGIEVHKQLLDSEIKLRTEERGKNNWHVALLEAAYQSHEFFRKIFL